MMANDRLPYAIEWREGRLVMVRPKRIEWGECDPAGIVYAPRYLDMFSESTVLLFEAAGLGKKRAMLKAHGVLGYPLLDVTARFRRPTAFGDDVIIEADAPVFGGSSFAIEHRLLLGGELCAECTEKRVWTVPNAGKPGGLRSERVPDSVRALFERNG